VAAGSIENYRVSSFKTGNAVAKVLVCPCFIILLIFPDYEKPRLTLQPFFFANVTSIM
jgi:hypothetical protein